MTRRLMGWMLLALAGLFGIWGCGQSLPTARAPSLAAPSPSPTPKPAPASTQAASPRAPAAQSAPASQTPRPQPTPPPQPVAPVAAAPTNGGLTALVVRPSVGIRPITPVPHSVGYAALDVGRTAPLTNYQAALRGAIDLTETMQLKPDALSSVG